MRIFIVVAKSRSDLFHYFSAAFTGIEIVEVILDRRFEQDDDLTEQDPDPQGNRRMAPDIYDELEERGFVIVRLP